MEVIFPSSDIQGFSDQKDNYLLSIAVDGNASFILTGDKKMLETWWCCGYSNYLLGGIWERCFVRKHTTHAHISPLGIFHRTTFINSTIVPIPAPFRNISAHVPQAQVVGSTRDFPYRHRFPPRFTFHSVGICIGCCSTEVHLRRVSDFFPIAETNLFSGPPSRVFPFCFCGQSVAIGAPVVTYDPLLIIVIVAVIWILSAFFNGVEYIQALS